MRRRAYWISALLLAAVLAGCAAGEGPAVEPPQPSRSPAVSAETPSAPVIQTENPLPDEMQEPPSAEPTVLPEPVPAEPVETPEPIPTATAEPPAADAVRNEDYFENSLFIGDSILEGIRLYVAAQRTDGTCLGEAKFLATTSGIGVADLVGDRQSGLQYRYKGEQQPLEQIVGEITPGRIFLLLGLNDLAAADPQIDGIVEQYLRLTERLGALCPGAEIVIVTNPPKVASTWLPDYTPNRSFSNELIDSFVAALRTMCEQQGIPCIDLHAALENEAGVLPEEYCSDGFVHLNSTGAAAAVEVLYEYAEGKG